MTQQEFEARTNVSLTQELFWEVNEEYNQSEKDVDAFCKWWIKNRLHDYTKRMTSDLYNLTELVMVLNHKIAYHYNPEKGAANVLANLYNELWEQADNYANENLKDEEYAYFYRITD